MQEVHSIYQGIQKMVSGIWESFPSKSLTHSEEAPSHSRCSEAGKHVVCGREMGKVWACYGLDAALAPHVDLATLRLSSGCVAGVAGGHLHHPKHN